MNPAVPILVFDIESIPDTEGIRKIHGLASTMTDLEVADWAFKLQIEKTKRDFLPLYLQRVVTVSILLRVEDKLHLWSLSEPELGEKAIVERFFRGLERYVPTLVSWNGSGFDLPVLNYRALKHGVVCPIYWKADKGEWKYNNYLNRYHARHTDVMDVIANFQNNARAPLDELCKVLGLPGKIGMHGGSVWQSFCDGHVGDVIAPYCETDVMNLYLVYLQFQRMKGVMSPEQHVVETTMALELMMRQKKPHWDTFIAAWETKPMPEVS